MSCPSWWGLAKGQAKSNHPSRTGTVRQRRPHYRPQVEALEDRALPSTTAYQVSAGTVGSQAHGGPLGMDFDVNQGIVITRLGVFDSGSDGLSRVLTVRLYNRATQVEVANLTFAPGSGTLADGSRFLPLPTPVFLAPGFQGSVVAEGYGAGEENGNAVLQPQTWTTDDGSGLVSFVGGGRWGLTPGAFPTTLDGGPANLYAAGTFDYLAHRDIVSGPASADAGQAYTLSLNLPEASNISSWTIHWGDGTVDTLAGNPTQATHVYAAQGSYAIAATATDGALGTYGTVYRGVVLGANPAAYWRLDETTVGTAAQDEAGNNDAVYHNFDLIDLNHAGALAQDDSPAVHLNGFDQYVSLPVAAFGNYPTSGPTSNYALTFSVWFKTPGNGVILGQTGGAVPGGPEAGGWVPAVYVGTDGRVRSSLFWHDTTNIIASPGSYSDNLWHHVLVTYANGVETLYLDGALAGSQSGPEVGYAPGYAYYLGASFTRSWPALNGGWHYFLGHLDEAAVWSVALTPQQVQAQYLAGATGKLGLTVNAPVVTVPEVDAGADATLDEGGTFCGSGSFSDGAASGPWSAVVNYGDGSGDQALALDGGAFTLSHVYGDDGTYTVTVRVTNGFGQTGSDTLTVAVNNVAPSVHVQGPADGVRGQKRTFILGADDPSPADQAAGFTYTIDWGDGSPARVIAARPGNEAGKSVGHVYRQTGAYVVSVTATDQDGAVSVAATHSVTVTPWAVQVQPDLLDPSRTERVLVIGGTPRADIIHVGPSRSGAGVKVQLQEGGFLGQRRDFTAPAVDRVVVYGQSGSDFIDAAANLKLPAELHGGGGSDILRGGGGPSILLGEGGSDVLIGGAGRSLLIGGAGRDILTGRGAGSILVGDRTTFDSNALALRAVLAEWSSAADWDTRVAHLSGAPGGLNESYFLNAKTVKDDLAFDILSGRARRDWIVPDRGFDEPPPPPPPE